MKSSKSASLSSVPRTRNWAFIMYPESCPGNFSDILSNAHVDCLVSPIHDSDTNPDEEQKKPHYHVILVFSSVKSAQQAQAVSDLVCGTVVQAVSSLRNYARYLCHLDNPEKHQYPQSDVLSIGSLDYFDLVSSASDVDAAISAMEDWCDANGVFSYAQLCRYARKERPEWTRILRTRCTVHMRAYLQSCQWEMDHGIVYPSGSNQTQYEIGTDN